MGFAAHTFVDAVGHISEAIGIPAGLIALVLAPLATELPEKFNSIIWLRDNKDTLALGNITGGDCLSEHYPGLRRYPVHPVEPRFIEHPLRRVRPDLRGRVHRIPLA